MELWLKSYLSLFFDFERYGNLTWLAIPLFIYFMATIKKRKRWEIAIVFVLLLSCLALLGSTKGRGNPRYIFSLYPFTIGTIFIYAWEFIKKRNRYLKIGIFAICGILIFFSFYHSRKTYTRFWRTRVSLEEHFFPEETLEFINKSKDINNDNLVLVYSHRHLFYYHTNKKGIHYKDPVLRIFYRRRNKEAALNVLRNQLKVKYILVHWTFKRRMIRTLQNIITEDCDLIIKNKGLQLYRIRGTDDK